MSWMDPPDGRPWALLALCAGSLLLNVVLIASRALDEGGAPAPVAESEVVAAVTAPAAPPPAAVEPVVAPASEVEVMHLAVERSLAYTFDKADGARGDVLAAVFSRLFVWDLDLTKDLQPGDEIAVAFRYEADLPVIEAASLRSKKHGKTFHAYRFTPTGAPFASWFDETGEEVAGRLVRGPIDDYEQITSLLKDRPRHRGMDFKAPVGTPIVSPRDGTVVRTDWNWSNNGNCVEVAYRDGTLARFLHLSQTDVQAGATVKEGTVLGLSGNTGHSTAPHLHYELEKAGKVVDPIDLHGLTRRTVPDGDRDRFVDARRALDGLLAPEA